MKEFFEFSESVWSRPEPRQITATGGFLKPADVDRYFEILNRAKAKAGDSIYAKRIDAILAEIEPLKLVFDKLKRLGPNIQIKTSKDQPRIDGDLDKDFWRQVPYTFLPLRDMITGETPQHVETSVSFRWMNDNSALIIGVECREPKMANLRESCKNPDSQSIYADDMVQIQLETASGIRPLIVVNSAGVVLDECITKKLEDLAEFYKVSDVAVRKYPDRWTVELRIEGGSLSLLAKTSGFRDLLSPADLSGTFEAPLAPDVAGRWRRAVSQFATNKLGRSMWVMKDAGLEAGEILTLR
jgi:hypothetical protein